MASSFCTEAKLTSGCRNLAQRNISHNWCNLAPDALFPVQQDLATLLQVLRNMELPEQGVFFWRYKTASAEEHALMWGSLIHAHGFEVQFLERSSGSAKAVDTVGISLGLNEARRSSLPGVLWRTLGLRLSRMQ